MSRKGQLWRGDLAQHIEEYLAGENSAGDLLDWAMDHPLFEDQTDLGDEDQAVLAQGLGLILQMSEDEPEESRTTREQLLEVVELLWGRREPPRAP